MFKRFLKGGKVLKGKQVDSKNVFISHCGRRFTTKKGCQAHEAKKEECCINKKYRT